MKPREKLIEYGVQTLNDDELLAIMLGVGGKNENVFDMSRRLIEEYSLEILCNMSYSELSRIPGIKEGKATKILAVFEIARRVMKNKEELHPISSSKELYSYLKPYYSYLRHEVLTVVYVDSTLKVIKKKEYSDKSYVEIRIPIKEIIKDALAFDCYGLFLCHNHPSGNTMPSRNDITSTLELAKLLQVIGILLLDHIIIGENTFSSMNDKSIF